MNKNKIFTSAKKIFKSRDELGQEDLFDIEQQDITQEIEQLRAEIKAFYLEHPDKDPSMPDKIYVKDMNELEEKITEHIPKKVVEDEIVIKNIIEQEGPGGSNPLGFSRMKEYDLPDEYRSQVFSPNILDDETKAEEDTVEDNKVKKSDTDTVRELFGEELSRDMQSINGGGEEAVEINDVDDDIKKINVDFNSLKESLDQDLLKQLQEQRMEEEQDTEFKNKIFTHQGFSKSANFYLADESDKQNSNQDENAISADQENEDTQNMSDLLSKLLSEGKLEADLHNDENQEGSTDVCIPGLNMDYEEDADIESDSIDISDFGAGEDLKNKDEEELRENHDSNLSDLLSDLLSKDQNSVDKESSVEKYPDTEDYHNRVFISSVKAAKKKNESEEHTEDNRKEGTNADYKSDDKVIFQEYGGNDEEVTGLDINNLLKDDSDVKIEDIGIAQEKQENKSADLKNNNRLENNLKSILKSDKDSLKSLLSEENAEEKGSKPETEEDLTTEQQDQLSKVKEKLQEQVNSEEKKISVLDEPEAEMSEESDYDAKRVIETEEKEFDEKDNEKGNGQNNTENEEFLHNKQSVDLDDIENILNSLLDDSDSSKKKYAVNEDADKLKQAMESFEDPVSKETSIGKSDNIENILDSLMCSEAAEIPEKNILEDSDDSTKKDVVNEDADKLKQAMEATDDPVLKEKSIGKSDNIENIRDSLMLDTGSHVAEIQEKGTLSQRGLKQTEQDCHTISLDSRKIIHKKKTEPIAVVIPEKKKKVEKITRRENTKKPAENGIPEKKSSSENKKLAAELVKTDQSVHEVKVLTKQKRQSLLARLLQKIKNMFKKKPKMEIISQEDVIDGSNNYKSPEKETFINGLITGSVSGDNVTLNPLAVVKKDVIAQGKVLCLSGAAIMGKVNCESIIVEGTVFGEIEARGKVIIKNDALVLGNIYSSDVRITQGAMVQGDIFFKNPERKGK